LLWDRVITEKKKTKRKKKTQRRTETPLEIPRKAEHYPIITCQHRPISSQSKRPQVSTKTTQNKQKKKEKAKLTQADCFTIFRNSQLGDLGYLHKPLHSKTKLVRTMSLCRDRVSQINYWAIQVQIDNSWKGGRSRILWTFGVLGVVLRADGISRRREG
jgi:hypothetical protein